MNNEKEIERLKVRIKTIANEKEGMLRFAFGDEVLIRLLRELNERLRYIEETEVCFSCEGTGKQEHECDCIYCGKQAQTCGNCFGEGRTDK